MFRRRDRGRAAFGAPSRPARGRSLALVATASLAMVAGLLSPAAALAAPEPVAKPAPVDKAVQKKLDAKGAADLWLVFDEKADLTKASAVKDWTARGEAVVEALKDTANKSQAGAKEALKAAKATYTPYWISNRILVRNSTESLTQKLAGLPGVARVTETRTFKVPEPIKKPAGKNVNAVEWGVAEINADDVWSQYGVHGEGITVASIDTGVQFDHPALVGKYRGNQGNGTFDHNYNWFDPSNTCGNPSLAPCDNAGHGTHTMGTMIGDDSTGNQIGVAPGARWIAAKGCEGLGCSDTSLLSSGQWMLEPTDLNGENPRADLRPNIVNNSWGAGNLSEVDPWYDDIVTGWTASGIFGVFSNGNEGEFGCDTTGSPADSPFAYGVGAYSSNGQIAYFSSRGPGANGEIRPNISAPGDNVRSSLPGNSYGNYSGTSMAAPHVSGSVALVWSAAPALVGDIEGTRALLDETARDTSDLTCGGMPENNNVWGEGKLDVLAAVDAAPRGDTGVLTGTVTAADGGEPVAGARVDVEGPLERSTTTGPDGTYRFTLSTGSYTIDVTAFGFVAESANATVSKDATTTRDFALDAAPSYAVHGTVVDARGQPVVGATVKVDGTPIPPATTDAEGAYGFDSVPAGNYTITVVGTGCLTSQSKDVVVDSAEVVDFEVADRTDDYGYRCVVEDSEYVEADAKQQISGDDASGVVNVPFPAYLYGTGYKQLNVSTNGHLSFTAPATSFTNGPIPSTTPPNAAIYAFWDDLNIDADAGIYTKTVGTSPNRSFILEWRNAQILASENARIDAEIMLHEKGDITLAYRNIDAAVPAEQGLSATVGIENGTGTDGLQYSNGAAVLSNEKSVRYTLPANGFVTGTVTDKNDGNPVAGATVSVLDGDTVVRELKTGADGVYAGQVWVGSYTLKAVASNYTAAQAQVTVAEGQTVTKNFVLKTARAEIDAPELTWLLPQGNKQSATITLSNTGSAALKFEASEAGGGKVNAQAAKVSKTLTAKANPNAKTAAGRYTKAEVQQARPYAVGDVLDSWPTQGVSVAWGVGYTGSNVWISNPEAVRNTEFTTAGAPTGREWGAPWSGTWAGDMAFDTQRGLMCQVAVGADNGIHCWDQATGEVTYNLTGSPWSGISQRGLAYRPDDDSFYVGGWNEDVIYHVAGQSAAEPGAVLGQCSMPGASIAGLAYNTTANVLWVTTSTATNDIHQVNPDNCETISSMALPETAEFAGAGAELDSAGNLWATSQLSNTAYLLETGVPQSSDIPWLTVKPAKGSVAVGASSEITVSVDTTGLEAGVYRGILILDTSAGRQPTVQLPVQLVVAGYWKGVNSGGAAYTDTQNLPWVGDQAYKAGQFGWVGASMVNTANGTVDFAGTEDDTLYRDQRQGMDAYKFDRLPAGKYQVTLDFAEMARSPRVDWRRFDVDVDGQYVLVGYDIADEVGGRHADERSFVVDVPAGGSLQVTFHDRRGYQPSVVNAIRVVHRPDL